jgi:DNA-binding IclR family transcriptional regulator
VVGIGARVVDGFFDLIDVIACSGDEQIISEPRGRWVLTDVQEAASAISRGLVTVPGHD